MESFGLLLGHLVGDYVVQDDYMANNKRRSTAVCLLHCLAYTMAVWLFAWWWLPLWALPLCLLAHYPVDRYPLVAQWMYALGQSTFFEKLGPWSGIVVDNIYHLVCLFLLQALVNATGTQLVDVPTPWLLIPASLLILLLLDNRRRAVECFVDAVAATVAGECPDGYQKISASDATTYELDPDRCAQALVRRRDDANSLLLLQMRLGSYEDLLLLDPRQYEIDTMIDPSEVRVEAAPWFGELHLRATLCAMSREQLAKHDTTWLDVVRSPGTFEVLTLKTLTDSADDKGE